MSTWQLFRAYLISKLPKGKQRLAQQQTQLNETPQNISINHIAIVLDGTVEEIIRCENRLAALLLSEPSFVEFNPEEEYPQISFTRYENGQFLNPPAEKEYDG